MTPKSLRPQAGFSLIELMVGVVIAMLALAFALRMAANSERSREVALGGSDSMQTGMIALFSLSGDAGQAGFGLNDPILAGCNTVFNDTAKYDLASTKRGTVDIKPLAPVIIKSNGTAPDEISFYSGSSLGGTGSVGVASNYSSGVTFDVDRRPYGFAQGDVIVVAPNAPGGTCALAQISSNPATLQALPPFSLTFDSGSSYRFNNGGLGASFGVGAARVFNLGPAQDLSFHTWSVSNGLLKLRATNLSGASETASTVSDNIVSIKAQYGFDSRTGTMFTALKGMQVDRWSPTMIDADGDGVVGSAGDYQHIAAVRLAVVARSKAVERPNGVNNADCTATTTKPTVFGDAVPKGVTAVPVNVDVGISGDANGWQCYRYRVFETVVNLRNNGWRP